jgi:hypothetical protein
MLRDLGFAVHSLSDVVREEAAARGLPPERGHLIEVGNDLRRLFGPGALAERIVPRLAGRRRGGLDPQPRRGGGSSGASRGSSS